ncbi:hypothetical protein ACP4OV_024082 [Aristida adscensionis]
MEDVVDNANNISDQEESTGSIPGPLFSGTNLNKRLRSKVWDDFIPTFVDGKIDRAECMHCHHVFRGTHGTGSLLRHQAKCKPRTLKKPRQQEHTSFWPSTKKSTVAKGSDPKQKKLPFWPSSQKAYIGTEDAMPVQKGLALPDTPTNMDEKNREVDHNGSHEELAAPEPKHPALPDISADNNESNQSDMEITIAEQKNIPSDMNQKNQEADQDRSREEFIRIFAMHGHLPRMMEQEGFRKLVAWLNPAVKLPSYCEMMANTQNLFQIEKCKMKEKLATLRSRVCLSAYMWHYDPVLAFLCLRVHYIDDEWEKQEKIIALRSVDSSCNAKELSDIILGVIGQWDLDRKIFCVILDDSFINDSVALNVKANLQEGNPLAANRSLFVVRYASHLLHQIIQVGLDELDKIMERLSKRSRYTKSPIPSAVQYPNYRYAPSSKDWKTAKRICEILEDFHGYMDTMRRWRSPTYLFDTFKELYSRSDLYSQRNDEEFFTVLQKIKDKFKERWKVCFLHFCLPMVMDPESRMESIKCCFQYTSDNHVKDYIRQVQDTMVSLFNEYSNQVEDSNCSTGTGSHTGKGSVVDEDTLMEYYRYCEYRYSQPHVQNAKFNQRPLTEFDQYVQEPHLTTGKPSVLQWWKEHSLTYPTIARMARDMLALPCSSECKVATKIATLAISESVSKQGIEELVCTQDWLTLPGTNTAGEESKDYLK